MKTLNFSKTTYKRQVVLFAFLISFLLIIPNCTQNLNGSKTSSSSINCKTQTQIRPPFEEKKVQIDTSSMETESFSEISGIQNEGEDSIKLGLVVDTLCIAESQNPVLILGQAVEIPSELSHLNRAAISLTFNKKEFDLDQLNEDMEKSRCLIGISENHRVTLLEKTSSYHPSNIPLPHPFNTSPSFNDPKAGEQDHLDFLNHSDSIDMQNQITADVVVAVVDTGIDEDHPDLQDRLWDDGQGNHGKSFTSPIGEGESTIEDYVGHGTHVAGIIAAKQNNNKDIAGLNGDFVKIMTAKVLDGSGEGSIVSIYNGIQYAIVNGADAINLSLGAVDSESELPVNSVILDQSIIEAVNKGIVVIGAAGNDFQEISLLNCGSPACFSRLIDGLMAVSSVDTETGNLSIFSNYSTDFIEISAPGSENSRSKRGILSTFPGGALARAGGTSMASPVVVASVAFIIGYLKTKNISYTPASVEAFIKKRGSRSNSSLNPFIQESRIVDFGQISQNLKDHNFFFCH